eukprot:m.73472 g.73472  ORF g.73472 m.73472 type:complete len:242 (-) comp24561_c0_seq1:59-784(-)
MERSSKRAKKDEAEPESYHAPKIPRTMVEKESAKRLIVILEGAGLETVKVGKSFQLLSQADHMNILRKNNRDGVNCRPDITHQSLLMLLDSPLNKAGRLQVYIHTAKNVLIEVNPQTRIPRVYSRFAGLMVQLLHTMSVSAKGSGGTKLMKVIKNPVTDHLPTGCLKIATTFQSKTIMRLNKYIPTLQADRSIAFLVGAIAHGQVDTSYCDEEIACSEYAMSAAGVCSKLTSACEETWGIL